MSNDISTDNRMWHGNDAEGFKNKIWWLKYICGLDFELQVNRFGKWGNVTGIMKMLSNIFMLIITQLDCKFTKNHSTVE